jgi:hypothetical protein
VPGRREGLREMRQTEHRDPVGMGIGLSLDDLRAESRRRGYELVPTHRIKRISVLTEVSRVGADMDAGEIEYIENSSISHLAHEIATKLMEFKKTILSYPKPHLESPFASVYAAAELDVIVPKQAPPAPSTPSVRAQRFA